MGKRGRGLVAAVFAVASLGGCSTRPREFNATLAAPAASQTAFERDMLRCQAMVRGGVKKDFTGRAAQAVAGTGGGIAAGGFAAGLASTSASLGAGTATFVFGGPLIAFGVSRGIRATREKHYKAALGRCLNEYGYLVSGWTKRPKLTAAEIAALGGPAPK